MSTNSPITKVPIGTPLFNTRPSAGQQGGPIGIQEGGIAETANLSRTWILFLESLAQAANPVNPIVGFIMNSGATGTNVGPMLPAGRSGTANVVTVVIKTSDAATPLTFDIIQRTVAQQAANLPGASIFETMPTIPAGTASGVLLEFDDLVEQPLTVTENDVFTINISSGSTSWVFVAVVETTAASATGT